MALLSWIGLSRKSSPSRNCIHGDQPCRANPVQMASKSGLSLYRPFMHVNPVQIGKFLLENGKVLTLSRKSSLSRNCIYGDQPCGALDWCCEGLYCDDIFDGRYHPQQYCISQGQGCAFFSNACCFPYTCNATQQGHCLQITATKLYITSLFQVSKSSGSCVIAAFVVFFGITYDLLNTITQQRSPVFWIPGNKITDHETRVFMQLI